MMRTSTIKDRMSQLSDINNVPFLNVWDNATQSVVSSIAKLASSYDHACKKLVDWSQQREPITDVDKVMKNLHAYHGVVLSRIKMPGLKPETNMTEFTLFYSLMYHLLPEQAEERGYYKKVFAQLEKKILSETSVKKNLPNIISFVENALNTEKRR